VIPWVRVENGFYSLFLHCLRAEMPFRCKQAFPRRRSVSLTTYHLLGPPAVCPSVLQKLLAKAC
jgi:hypothetical protein